MSFFATPLDEPFKAPMGSMFPHEESEYITVFNEDDTYDFVRRDYTNPEHMKIICNNGKIVTSWRSRDCLGCLAEREKVEKAKYAAKKQVIVINDIVETTNISPDLAGLITEFEMSDVNGSIGVKTYLAFKTDDDINANLSLAVAESIILKAIDDEHKRERLQLERDLLEILTR